jgi:hypothetical protein
MSHSASEPTTKASIVVDLVEDDESTDGDTPRASMAPNSPFHVATTAAEEQSAVTSSMSQVRHAPLPTGDVLNELLPSSSATPSSLVSTPTATRMTASVATMQSELLRLGPPPPAPHRRFLRKRREALFRQVLKDSIVSAKTTESITLRTTVSEEVKTGLQGLLTIEEKDPRHTLTIIRSKSRSYWSKVHQEVHHNSLELNQLYTLRDIERTLFFWANHQHVMSYGEIAYELCLPLGVLSSWILRYIERI